MPEPTNTLNITLPVCDEAGKPTGAALQLPASIPVLRVAPADPPGGEPHVIPFPSEPRKAA
jgi:hypothetical protein